MLRKIELFVKVMIGVSFFVPLLVVSSSFIFPFIVPKILFFRSLVMLMLGGYIILLAGDWEKYKLKLTPVNITVGAFLLSFVVSTFVGVDWYKSFWDNHERMLGLFTIIHFVFYYFIATTVVSGWKEWRRLLRLFLFAGCIVMFIGLIQKINPEFLVNRGSERVSATLGNAIYFSAYGMFLFFIGLFLACKEESRRWKIYAWSGALIGFWGIFAGGTRGTFLGLVMGTAILLSVYFLTLLGHKKIKLAIVGLIVVLPLVLFAFRQTDFVKNIPLAGQVINLNLKTDLVTGTIGSRIMAWGIAVDSWKEKPLFGWGPNNYYYAFNKYYKPEFLGHGWGETWFDNAHSALINTLSVQGLVGILSYLGTFIVPLFMAFLAYRKKIIDQHVLAVSFAFLAGHFTHNFFVFENPTSYLYFFFFLAFINQIISPLNQTADQKTTSNKFPLGFSVVVTLFVILLIYTTNINPARANMMALNAIRNVYTVSPSSGIEAFKKAEAMSSPHIDDIRMDFAKSANEVMALLIKKNNIADAEMLFNSVYPELQKNFSLHPMDIRINMQQSQMASVMAQITNDAEWLVVAESALDKALEYSPKRQQIQYMLSLIKLQLNKKEEAIALLRDSINNKPDIGEGWWRLAMTYEHGGDHDQAVETIKEAREKGIVFSGQGESVVATILK